MNESEEKQLRVFAAQLLKELRGIRESLEAINARQSAQPQVVFVPTTPPYTQPPIPTPNPHIGDPPFGTPYWGTTTCTAGSNTIIAKA